MKSEIINSIIEDFDSYIKKSEKFSFYAGEQQKFRDSLTEVLTYSKEQLYKKGKKEGEGSFIRNICSEEVMGTRVGQIYGHVNGFFYSGIRPNEDNFTKFKDFLISLNRIINSKPSEDEINTFIIDAFSTEKLYAIKTVLIQILSVYLCDKFLPIYQPKELRKFISDLITPKPEKKDILKSREKNDFGCKLILLNQILMDWKNDHEIARHWDNIKFAHFLFKCLPLKDLMLLRNAKIDMDWLETNEQFVVAIFSKIHQKLCYETITDIRTFFPDCEVIDSEGNIKLIEFEFNSKSYLHHKDSKQKCDAVVCWEIDNPLEEIFKKNTEFKIVGLKDELKRMDMKPEK